MSLQYRGNTSVDIKFGVHKIIICYILQEKMDASKYLHKTQTES
jgi:hypothetical protein